MQPLTPAGRKEERQHGWSTQEVFKRPGLEFAVSSNYSGMESLISPCIREEKPKIKQGFVNTELSPHTPYSQRHILILNNMII